MKGSLWQFISNSFAFQITFELNYYESLVAKQHENWLEISKYADGTKRDEATVSDTRRVYVNLNILIIYFILRFSILSFNLFFSVC